MARQPKALRISFRSEEARSLSGTHQEHTQSLQTSHSASCVPSSSAVKLHRMSGGTCREQSSTGASDSSMCGSNCASQLERASGSSRKISRRKGNFPLASIPAADIPRSYSFYSPVMSEDSGRHSRDEIAWKHKRQQIDSGRRNRNNGVRGGKENTATRNPHRQWYQRPSIEIWNHPNDHQREVGQCGFRFVRTPSNRERFARTHTWNG